MKDLTQIKGNIFYTYIYKKYAKQFLLSNNYENFATLLQNDFILTPLQWNEVLNEWNIKQSILAY